MSYIPTKGDTVIYRHFRASVKSVNMQNRTAMIKTGKGTEIGPIDFKELKKD